MLGFKIGNNISPQKKTVRGTSSRKLPQLDLGCFLLLGLILIFLVRVVIVLRSNGEIGSYASIKMLNVGMPVVNTQGNNKAENLENNLSLKSVVLESLGLANINLVGIVGNEISYYSGAIINNPVISDHSSGFTKFKVNESTIAKLTPEEIAELNDVSKAYKPSLKKPLAAKPEVLIYHTHTMEHYSNAQGQNDNPDANVVGVGAMLTKELEEGYGISVVHDKTNYSITDYNNAYDKSREGLKKYLEEYGGFKLVIDLHRDGVSEKSTSTAFLDNKSLAKFMFVTSQNVSTYDANQKIVDNLYGIGKKLFPDLIKPTRIFEGVGGINGFNQGFSEGSMIIEVGSQLNSPSESQLTAKYIARILAEYLNGEQ